MSNETKTIRDIAIEWHKNTYGDRPYVYHLDAVYEAYKRLFGVAYSFQDAIAHQACYAHDLLEDTEIPREQLSAIMHPVAFDAAVLLTKDAKQTRKEYLQTICESDNIVAYRVKVADAYCNLTESIRAGNVYRVVRYTDTINYLHANRKK